MPRKLGRSSWTSPADVREVARRKLPAWLSGLADGREFTPVRIPVAGPVAAEFGARFDEARNWAGEWERAARGPLRVEYKKVGGRSFGVNEVPCAAWIDSYKQAWEFLGAVGEAARLAGLADRTKAACPSLVPWLVRRPLKGLELAAAWDRLLATVRWVDQCQAPGMYLRQVDVPGVDTKFIERHRGTLAELLNLQLTAERVNASGDGFESRYGFRCKPGYVRFRLGSGLRFAGLPGLSELTARVDELTAVPSGTARVYVVENEITYLAFPLAADAIVIFGGGYAVGLLEPLHWLADLDVVYWGDIDTHGFAILSRLRRHFPRLTSMLMDRDTLIAHQAQWVTEAAPTTLPLEYLTPSEQDLYRDLGIGEYGPAVRLEQERVSFARIQQAMGSFGV
jgi:hypothetical protein